LLDEVTAFVIQNYLRDKKQVATASEDPAAELGRYGTCISSSG
jgi:hypothetical protein